MGKKYCPFIKKDGSQCKMVGPGYCRFHQKNKKSSSAWLFTISTNRKNEKLDEAFKQKFHDLMEFLFGDGIGILNFISDKEGPLSDILLTTDVNYNCEIGEKYKVLHCHAVLKLVHKGFVTLHANKLRSLMRRIFGYNLYLECPVSRDAIMLMNQYVNKEKSQSKNQLATDLAVV